MIEIVFIHSSAKNGAKHKLCDYISRPVNHRLTSIHFEPTRFDLQTISMVKVSQNKELSVEIADFFRGQTDEWETRMLLISS